MFSIDLVTPSEGQGHWKWNQIVEVNGAYQHSKYERTELKSLHVTSNVKVFAMKSGQTDRQTFNGLPASPINTTDYIGPYATHMDKRKKNLQH